MVLHTSKLSLAVFVLLILCTINYGAFADNFTQDEATTLLSPSSQKASDQLLEKASSLKAKNELWPITTYLSAEAHYSRKETSKAESCLNG